MRAPESAKDEDDDPMEEGNHRDAPHTVEANAERPEETSPAAKEGRASVEIAPPPSARSEDAPMSNAAGPNGASAVRCLSSAMEVDSSPSTDDDDDHDDAPDDSNSNDHDGAVSSNPTQAVNPARAGEHDRMAMMAAVAMTELLSGLGGKDSPTKHPSLSLRPDAQAPVQSPTPPRHHRAESSSSLSSKRRSDTHATESIYVSKRRKSGMSDDDEVQAVVASTSYMSVESRNPSPVDKGQHPHPHQHQRLHLPPSHLPPHQSYHASHYGSGPPLPPSRSRHPHEASGHPPTHARYRSSPPPSDGYSPARTPMPHHHQQHQYHHHPAYGPPDGYHYPYPPTYYEYPGGSYMSPSSASGTPPHHPHRGDGYDDLLLRGAGLPKSLSFRKVCSKCGKTRSEHGESTGFGNKCTFQVCGKCCASLSLHVAAGSPMGVHCRLAVEQGARPGSAAAYRRKLQELAARADLQKEMREADRTAAESAAPTVHPSPPPAAVVGPQLQTNERDQ
jgi:hypothetical protein